MDENPLGKKKAISNENRLVLKKRNEQLAGEMFRVSHYIVTAHFVIPQFFGGNSYLNCNEQPKGQAKI